MRNICTKIGQLHLRNGVNYIMVVKGRIKMNKEKLQKQLESLQIEVRQQERNELSYKIIQENIHKMIVDFFINLSKNKRNEALLELIDNHEKYKGMHYYIDDVLSDRLFIDAIFESNDLYFYLKKYQTIYTKEVLSYLQKKLQRLKNDWRSNQPLRILLRHIFSRNVEILKIDEYKELDLFEECLEDNPDMKGIHLLSVGKNLKQISKEFWTSEKKEKLHKYLQKLEVSKCCPEEFKGFFEILKNVFSTEQMKALGL